MQRKLPQRRDARRALSLTGRKPFRYDQHGDVVDLDDQCGADVVPGDLAFNRLLASSPVRR